MIGLGGNGMVRIRVENFAKLAVVECSGRIVHSDAVFKLRDTVQAQDTPVIILDMSEVDGIGGGGLGMLVFLEHWARENEVQLKLFCPSDAVLEGLAQIRFLMNLEIATFQEVMGLLARAGEQYGSASSPLAA
jgi:anti-anti-sigma regulatory factor